MTQSKRKSYLHTPEAFSTAHAQGTHGRGPGQIADFVFAIPDGRGASFLAHARSASDGPWSHAPRYGASGTHQIPQQDAAVVAAGREDAPLSVAPVDAVDRGAVAFELEECLAWLADVEDPDDVGVLREGREEVRVMGRGGDA